MVNVMKADGTVAPFDPEKVVRTCKRMRLSKQECDQVLDEIEGKLYEGIPTKKVIHMIIEIGKRHRPHFAKIIDLREALGIMKPAPDFEQYVAMIFESMGYKTITNKIIRGGCIEHEIDVIAIKGSETVYVEVKHHNQFHTFTGVDVVLQMQSTLQDLQEGYIQKKHKYNFTKATIVCNTRVSAHAQSYSLCKDMGVLSWGYPKHNGIEAVIHYNFLYPVTVLRQISKEASLGLSENRIFTLKQLVSCDRKELLKNSNISEKELESLIHDANSVLSS